MKKKFKYFSIIFIIIILLCLYILGKCTDPYFGLKCPDDFDNREEQMADYNNFLDRFLQNSPNATGQDIINERLVFFEKHNCTKAIERYKLSQAGQKSSIPEVREAIQESLEERGFRILED